MVFEIIWDPKAIKFLDKLPKDYALRIANKIKSIRENPERYLETLVGYNFYKLRTGDFRIFINLDNNTKIISVMSIRHRREAYNKK